MSGRVHEDEVQRPAVTAQCRRCVKSEALPWLDTMLIVSPAGVEHLGCPDGVDCVRHGRDRPTVVVALIGDCVIAYVSPRCGAEATPTREGTVICVGA